MIACVFLHSEYLKIPSPCQYHGREQDAQNNLAGVSCVGASQGVDRYRTSGSPHGGNLYIGSLFHRSGGGMIVRFDGIIKDMWNNWIDLALLIAFAYSDIFWK